MRVERAEVCGRVCWQQFGHAGGMFSLHPDEHVAEPLWQRYAGTLLDGASMAQIRGTDHLYQSLQRMGSSNLFPELLLALVGHTGDAFVRRDAGAIVLADVVDWVTPPERCVEGEGWPARLIKLPKALLLLALPASTQDAGRSLSDSTAGR